MGRLLLAVGLTIALSGISNPAWAQHDVPRLGDIVIEGNTKTDRAVIERVIGLAPGTPLTLITVDVVWDRLEDCGYFAFVDLDTEEDDDGTATLHVSVEEEKTFRGTPYVRYDRRHKYLLGLAIRDANLRGKGEILEVEAIGYRIQRGRVAWTRPYLANVPELSLRVDGLWEQGAFVWRPFDYSRWHALASLRWQLTGAVYAELGGGHESFDQQDDYDWNVGGTIGTFAGGIRNTWMVRTLLGVDKRDNPFYPTSGCWHTAEWTHRGGADIDGQMSWAADLRRYLSLGRTVLALRASGRISESNGVDEYVVRWGGPETVRGAPYAGREGDSAYLCSAEIRWPLAMMPVAVTGETVGLGLHAFTDVGDAWFEHRDQWLVNPSAYADRPGKALWSYGVGVHVSLLTWQLRFEAAHERDHGWSFEFMDVFNF